MPARKQTNTHDVPFDDTAISEKDLASTDTNVRQCRKAARRRLHSSTILHVLFNAHMHSNQVGLQTVTEGMGIIL